MTPSSSSPSGVQDFSLSGLLIAVNNKKPSFFQTLDYICDVDVTPTTLLRTPYQLREGANTFGTFVIKYTLDIWKIIAFSASGLALLLLIVVIGQMSRR